MPLRTLSLDKRGPIARLTLARPVGGNAVDGALLADLASACEAVRSDDGVRVLLLSGDGPVFCSGWDPELLTGEDLAAAARSFGLPGDPFHCLADLPQPVVCALNGDAFSAGLELALACDIRLAAEGARFALPETGLGLLPLAGGLQRLARAVGRARALELVLSAAPIDAAVALRWGLLSAVVPRDRLHDEAEALAGRIVERGPLAVRYAKEAVRRGLEMPLEQALRYETDLTIIIQTTEDRAEGVRAFLEKRQPQFRGK